MKDRLACPARRCASSESPSSSAPSSDLDGEGERGPLAASGTERASPFCEGGQAPRNVQMREHNAVGVLREEPLRMSARLFLRQCFYVLTFELSAAASPAGTCELSVAARNEAEGAAYVGSFPRAFVEEMTRRTGRGASMEAFWGLLRRAVRHRAGRADSRAEGEPDTASAATGDAELDEVTLNLWDGTDLEALRRSAGGPAKRPSLSDAGGKHFLIVTHRVGARRVHYPLALLRQGRKAERAPAPAQDVRREGENAVLATACEAEAGAVPSGAGLDAHRVASASAAGWPSSPSRGFSAARLASPPGSALVSAVELSSARSATTPRRAASLRRPGEPQLEGEEPLRDAGKALQRAAAGRDAGCRDESHSRALSRRESRRPSLASTQEAPVEQSDGTLEARRLATRLQHVETELLVTARQLDAERHLRAREAARLRNELEKARHTETALRNRIRELEATLRLTSFRSSRSPSTLSLLPPTTRPSPSLTSSRVSSASSSRRGSAATAVGVCAAGARGAASPLSGLAGSGTSIRRVFSHEHPSLRQTASSPRASSPFSSFSRSSPRFLGTAALGGVRTLNGIPVRYVRRGGGALVPVPIDDSSSDCLLAPGGRGRRRSASSASLETFYRRDDTTRGRARSRSASLDGGSARPKASSAGGRVPLSRSSSARGLGAFGANPPRAGFRSSSPMSLLSSSSTSSLRPSIPPRGGQPAARSAARQGSLRSPSRELSSSAPRQHLRGHAGKAAPLPPCNAWSERERFLYGTDPRDEVRAGLGTRQQLLRGVDCSVNGPAGGFEGRRLSSAARHPSSSAVGSRGASSWASVSAAQSLSRDATPPADADAYGDEEGSRFSGPGFSRVEGVGGDSHLRQWLRGPAPGEAEPAAQDRADREASSYVMVPVVELRRLLQGNPQTHEPRRREPHDPYSCTPVEKWGDGPAVRHPDRGEAHSTSERGGSADWVSSARLGFGESSPRPAAASDANVYSAPLAGSCEESNKGTDVGQQASQEAVALREGTGGVKWLSEGFVQFERESQKARAFLPHLLDPDRQESGAGGVSHARHEITRKPDMNLHARDLEERTSAGVGDGSTQQDKADAPRSGRDSELALENDVPGCAEGAAATQTGNERKRVEAICSFPPFPKKGDEGGASASPYSEIDRRLSALQDFLKSTRQTFKMLERGESIAL
ncbi:hypothetical protein BESB_059400 [Besnoitia besnoiti]|uniref:Uncharacterized protein n=1 Tax=Besnoitia besnoiti TaxID=94643 RepID=A0A2A9MHC3_BESBE|nr:hypothetical protein BESB_059400 [Besnoitia besnoiti]PFH35053.1 hypothetical protein BESB_059400 [Besnoitia besnoiti]